MTDWQDKYIASFNGGLNITDRTDLVADNELIDAENVVLEDGLLKISTGYYELSVPAVTGFRYIYMFTTTQNVVKMFLFTKTTLYHWSGSAWTQVYLADGSTPCSFTGDNNKPISIAAFTPENVMVWTNGVDVVQKIYYDDATHSAWECIPLEGLAGSGSDPDVDTCIAVVTWVNRMWLLGTVEVAGENLLFRIRYSDAGDVTAWTADVGGYYDIYGSGDSIITGFTLADQLIVYKTSSIWRGRWIGSTSQAVVFDKMIGNEGVIGGVGVAQVDNWHVVVGKGNIYRYTGGLSLEPIGNKIKDIIYGRNGFLDLDYADKIRAYYLKESNELWILFPTASNTTVLRYLLHDNTWYKRVFDLVITSLSPILLELDDTWSGGSDDSWEDGADVSWLSQSFQDDFAYMSMSTNSSVIVYDFTTGTEDGVAVDYFSTTKDLSAGKYFVRTDYIELYCSGGEDIDVFYSTDRGYSWQSWGTITPTSLNYLAPSRLYKQVVCRDIRFKISGSGGGAKFGSLNIHFIEESSY